MRLAALVFAVAALAASLGAAQTDVNTLLDRYERGEHDAVLETLMASAGTMDVARELGRVGASWTRAKGKDQERRRQLIAASFALEAAAPRFWPEEVDPLIEFGCQLLRKGGPPDAKERIWELASVAIYGRARDDGKLVTRAGPGAPLGSRQPASRRSVDHIAHARVRFPDEPRFQLAQAMSIAASADTEPARDATWIPTDQLARNTDAAMRRARATQAIQLFEPLAAMPALGAEASLRIGYLRFVLHDPAGALTQFEKARDTNDAFVAYLARFLSGRALDALSRRDDANAMYRDALKVLPHAQSAAEALAANLFLAGKADEAYALAENALATRAPVEDPWHMFGYGDHRLIPALMVQLRKELQ